MAGLTNKGKYHLLNLAFLNATEPTYYYVALVKTTPTVDTNLMSDLTEIDSDPANGYTSGGIQLTRDATGFDTITEDDALDKAYVKAKDLVWTASGGTLPSDGNGATHAVLTNDNATVSLREVYGFVSLGGATVIGDGATLTISDFEIDLTES